MADDAISVPGIDAWVFSQPHESGPAGGDIHYVSMCGHGAISRFLLADVAGHGVNVATIAGDLRQMMRRHINQLDNARLAEELNEEFAEHSDAGDFATALIGTYFAPTDQFIIANAGHPRPLWYRSGTRQWQWLDPGTEATDEVAPKNLPLGVIAGTGYRQFAVTLEAGDLLVFYSDALIEAANPAGRQLGQTGLLGMARGLEAGAPMRVGHDLIEAVGAFGQTDQPDDDLTLLVLHHNAADPPALSLGERLKTMAKMMGLIKV
jgi:serine phosphatase RsbU (regulator of sigma subunit)